MHRARVQVVWLIIVSEALTCLPVFPADPACSLLDASATFSTTLSFPPTAETPFAQVRMAIAQGNLTQAEDLLLKAPSDVNRSIWQGILLLHSGKPFSAIRSLEEAARLHNTSMVQTLLGVVYLLLNQRQLTSKAIGNALEFDPKNDRALYLRGRFNFITHNYSQAEQDFRAVLETEPHDYRTLFYLGYSEWRLGKQSPALEHLRRSVAVIQCHHLSFALAPQTLAEFQLETGNLNEALSNSNLAVSLSEQSTGEAESREEIANALVLRGKIHSALGQAQEAVQDWQRAVALSPDLAEGWYLLAHVYQRRGEAQKAADSLAHFKRVHDEL